MCTCIYRVFVLFLLCIFILFVASLNTTATEWKLNCSKWWWWYWWFWL